MTFPKNPENLYYWQPDRRRKYTRIVVPPIDNEGKSLNLYDGMQLAPEHSINICLTKKGELPDFLYDIGLLLIVSNRAYNLISQARVPGVQAHSVAIRDNSGRLLCEYYWLNQCSEYNILDKIRSSFRMSENGIMREISDFVVDASKIPDEDLFLCEDAFFRVFSKNLVKEIGFAKLTGAIFAMLPGSHWP